MGKGWYGIASHQGMPAAALLINAWATGLPHYVHNLFFSLPLRCGLSLILRDRKARGNGIDEEMYRS